MLARYHRRRAEAISKLGGQCAHCGTIENLEFDHIVASNKSYNIGKLFTSASEAKLASELSKCQLLCTECHKIKTAVEKDSRVVEHGGGKIGKKACYCELCGPLKREWQRLYRQRNK